MLMYVCCMMSDEISVSSNIDSLKYIDKIKNFLTKHAIPEPINNTIHFESTNLEVISKNQSSGRIFKLD